MMNSALLFVVLAALCEGSPTSTRYAIPTPTEDGRFVKPGEIPYQVSIQDSPGFHICTGSILTENYVLTAAQCVVGETNDAIKIVSGVADFKVQHSSHDVSLIIVHPDYHSTNPLINDIALVKVKGFTFSETVGKVELPVQGSKVKKYSPATTSGWGRYNTPDDSWSLLRRSEIIVMPQKYCEAVCSTKNIDINEHQICAYDPINHQKSCYTDKGSPLTVNGKIEGIASYVDYCGNNSSSLIIHTRVADYVDWINSHIS